MFPYQAYGAVRQLYLNKKPGDAGNFCKTEISNQRFLVGDSKKHMPWCETPRRWVLVVENTMIMCSNFFLFQFSGLITQLNSFFPKFSLLNMRHWMRRTSSCRCRAFEDAAGHGSATLKQGRKTPCGVRHFNDSLQINIHIYT